MDDILKNPEEISEDHTETVTEPVPHSRKSSKHSILSLALCPDPFIVTKVAELLSDKNVRISHVSEMILKDPVTTLEILSKANSGNFAGEKSRIVAVQTAVVRIGSEELFNLVQLLTHRSSLIDSRIASEMAQLRSLACRAAIIAETLSSHLQRDIVEVSQTCALLSYFGLMLACETLKEDYLELAHIKKRSTLNYRLQTNHSFDPGKVQLEYFQSKNLPLILFYAFDKELKCKTSAQSSLRFIVEASMELSEAQDEGKLEKYRHFHKLPPKSSLRLLKITEPVYETIFAEIEEALGLGSGTNNRISKDQSEIENNSAKPTNEEVSNLAPVADSTKKVEFISSRAPTLVMDRSEIVNYFTQNGSAVFIEKATETIEQERGELSSSAEAIIGMLQSICNEATSARKLMEDLMEVVTEKGPFSRTAVIEVTENRKEAFVHTALGEDFANLKPFQTIEVSDPLSPLSTVITKVQSFNSKNNTDDKSSPFGITSYAVSPIRSSSMAQLVFYADCGAERPLPLEARKVFRLAVALLNEALPRLTELKAPEAKEI